MNQVLDRGAHCGYVAWPGLWLETMEMGIEAIMPGVTMTATHALGGLRARTMGARANGDVHLRFLYGGEETHALRVVRGVSMELLPVDVLLDAIEITNTGEWPVSVHLNLYLETPHHE